MRPIDKKFFVSALIFVISCIVYAAVVRYFLAHYGPKVSADFEIINFIVVVSIATMKDMYWLCCSIFFGVLMAQWIINQQPVNSAPRKISLVKPPAH